MRNLINKITNKVLRETLENKTSFLLEKLKGKQHKLDKNKNGRLDSEDFKMLRNMNEGGGLCEECGSELKEGETCECGMGEGIIYEVEIEESETCEECGSELKEGETCECGMNEGNLNEKWKGNVKVKKTGEHSGKSISDIDSQIRALKNLSEKYQEKGEKVPKKLKEKMSELYFAKRSKKGWPSKGKVDVDEEMEEGNAFAKRVLDAKKSGDKNFNFKGKKYPVEEMYELNINGKLIQISENNLINMIEKIVILEENKMKMKKPKGYTEYEKNVKKSKSESDAYLKDVTKKMKEYLKDGSKGSYETNPKHFPKGNGQLAKMGKKAYELSSDGQEFIDDFYRPGMETLDYDEMHPNEDWITDNIEGSSKTGNNQDWANAEKTETNKKINKTRKKNSYNKVKRKAYNKSAQPVITDKPGQEKGSGLHLNLENTKNEKQLLKLNEDLQRMSNLINYNNVSQ